jgi:hypothetical protein
VADDGTDAKTGRWFAVKAGMDSFCMILDLDEVQREFTLINGKMPPKAFLFYTVLLAFLSMAIFWSSLSYPFIGWDDYAYYLDDPATQSLTLTNLKIIFTEPRLSVWYPLARLSHAIDFYFFGAHAAPSRFINVILHLANSLMVFSISLLCLRHSKLDYPDTQFFVVAALVGILFCVHPQHVEAIIWISQRKELLSALCFFSAIYLYLRYLLVDPKPTLLIGTQLLGILAMLAKPISVTLFPILLLIACMQATWVRGKCDVETVWASTKRLGPLLIAGAVIGWLTIHNHDNVASLSLDQYFPLPQRLELSIFNFLHTLLCWGRPLYLSPARDIPAFVNGQGIILAAFLLASIVLVAVFVRADRKIRILLYALAMVFIVHLPVSGILMFGTYASGDRYAYIATMPLFILLGFCLLPLTRRLNRAVFVSAVIFLVACLASLSIWQTRIWKNDFTLWSHVVQDYPRNAMSLYYLGDQYKQLHRYPEAIIYMEQAIALGPVFRGYPPFIGVADVAEMYKQSGDFPKALEAYKRVLHYYGESATLYAAMGMLELLTGNADNAFADFDKAYALDKSIVLELNKQLPYLSANNQALLAGWLERPGSKLPN